MQDCNLVQFEREENVFGGCNVVEDLIFLTSGRASRYNFGYTSSFKYSFPFQRKYDYETQLLFPQNTGDLRTVM